MAIGKRIKLLREQKSLTQEQLAKMLNLSQQTIDHYEKERAKPSIETVALMAKIFNVTTDYLLGRTDDPSDVHQRIEAALAGEPDGDDLIAFWQEMKEREDLKLLFKQVRPLTDDSIRKVIRVIQAIELEESQE